MLPDDRDNDPDKLVPLEIRSLQRKLQERLPGRDLHQLKARLERELWPVAPSGLAETVDLPAIELVLSVENAGLASDWQLTEDETWLTEAEHQGAWELIKRVGIELAEFRKSGRRKKKGTAEERQHLNTVFTDEGLREALASKGLKIWDAHYAVCTLVDWLNDREDDRYVMIG
jgi:hypothetical protein